MARRKHNKTNAKHTPRGTPSKSKNLHVGQDGKVQSQQPNRSLTKGGPTVAVPKKEAKKIVTKISHAEKMRKRKEDNTAIYVTGSVPTRFESVDSLRNIIAFAQCWVARLAVDQPNIFCHEDTQIGGRTLYPVDFVAYAVVCIIGAYNRIGALRGDIAGIFQKLGDEVPLPIAIAEYCQRIHLVGAPEIMSILNMPFNPSIATGEITYNASNPYTNLSYNMCVGNAAQIELWQYGTAPDGSATADVQDLSAYSFNFTAAPLSITQLFGSNQWVEKRFPVMVDYINDLSIGKVHFKDVPMCTTDPSSFAGAGNGSNWNVAQTIEFPAKGGNAYLAIALNPVPRIHWFPGTVNVKSVPRPGWKVTGGLYGNNPANFAVAWAGQPVVPATLDIFMESIQYFMAITMYADGLKPRFFGKQGYTYHGIPITDFGSIVSVPIDYPALVQKCLTAHFDELNETAAQGDSAVFAYGYVQGVALMYGAMIMRKVLNSQLEIWSSLAGSTLLNTWKFQTLVPTQSYIQGNKLPLPIATLLNELAPTGVRGIMRVPCIGAGYLYDAFQAGNTVERYYLFPKWVGYAPAGTYLSNGLIPNPTTADPGDPKTWTFPRVMGASPAPADVALEYTNSAWGEDSAYTVFPSNVAVASLVVPGASVSQLVAGVLPQGPIYNNQTLNGPYPDGPTWATAAVQGGKITYLGFQWLGAKEAVKKNTKLLAERSKVNSNRMAACAVRGVVGGASMSTNLQYVPNYSANKPVLEIALADFDGDGETANPARVVGVCMDYHGASILQCMAFCNQARLCAAFLHAVSTYAVAAQSTPAGIAVYSTGPYSADMQDTTTQGVWEDFVIQCGQETSAVNDYVTKHSRPSDSKANQEQTFRFGTAHKNHDVSVTDGALNSYAQTITVPECVTEYTMTDLNEAMFRFNVTKVAGQQLREIQLLAEDSPYLDSPDASMKGVFDQAWKGIKWVAPKALKAAVELAPLFL